VDRDRIERRDFPTSRRGYDTAAVDAHLRELADAFEARTAPPAQPLSSATSEQVRHILEAAERSVGELRARANEEATAHVARVQSAADGLLGKLDALEAELGTLLGALRTSGERLQAGLAELQAEVGRGEVAPAAPPVVEDLAAFEEDFAAEAPADEAGARLIALNMALDGKPREETARYLAEHFALADADALLDDVYARAGR
jgi:DivIVA domain-containing protein